MAGLLLMAALLSVAIGQQQGINGDLAVLKVSVNQRYHWTHAQRLRHNKHKIVCLLI